MSPEQPVGPPVPGWAPRRPLEPVALHGRFVDVVPLTVAHAPQLHEATGRDARSWTYLSEEMPGSVDAFAAYLAERADRPDQAAVTIVPHGVGPAGLASWLRCDAANGSVEVGSILFGPALSEPRRPPRRCG